jgi:type I restriction enzyme S subunit
MGEYNNELIEFPKDWNVRKLKDVIIKAKSGGTPRRNVPEYWNGNIPFAKAQDITKAGKYLYNTEELITEKGLENSNAWIVPKDSLLLTIYGSLGFVAINKILVATNQAIVGIIPNKNIIDTEFLYYWYLYFKPYWSKFIKKGTQPNLTLEIVLNSSVPIPPLEEQKKIAEILNTVDFIIIDTTNLIEKLKLLKEKTLNLLITGKIWHKEFKDTEIGKFPKDWEIKRLGEIAEQMYYGLSVSGIDTPTQYKLITTTSINKETFKLDEENIPFCNLITNKDIKSKELTKYFVKKGDILISRSGTTGITILIDKDYNNMLFGSYLIKIRLNSIIDPKFFWYFAQSPFYWKQISSRGATIKNINLEILRNLRVPIPPLEEQKKIVEILSTIDNKIETETKYLDYMKKLKERLLSALMTGKIRVNSITIGDLR